MVLEVRHMNAHRNTTLDIMERHNGGLIEVEEWCTKGGPVGRERLGRITYSDDACTILITCNGVHANVSWVGANGKVVRSQPFNNYAAARAAAVDSALWQ